MDNARMSSKFVAALDVGTTTVRCHILDQRADTLSVANRQVELLYPEPGRVEIVPEQLWTAVVEVVREAIAGAGLSAQDVTCMGISTQRCTFVTWHKTSGVPFHNFITWQDIRADKLVRAWNNSFTMRSIRTAGKILYTLTRNKRFLAASVLKLMNPQVTLRLLWVLDNVPGVREAEKRGEVMFGTLDTYILYRVSGGKTHVTDVSSASATGMFDPFTLGWADWAFSVFKIPRSIMPPVCDSASPHLAMAAQHIWGAAIPISCSMADQSGSLYGSCCFDVGDVKVTMGTGAFLDVNTGHRPHASVAGLYPLVGWRVGDDLAYVAEGASNDNGTLINWAVKCGILKDPQESSRIAESVEDSDGIFFIPAFSGLQAPINDARAAAGFLGVKPSTTSSHMVRAVLESIVFRVTQLLHVMHREADFPCNHIRVDGGVSRNDFVLQLLADVSGLKVERPVSSEMSALGVGFMAGVAAGVWSGKDELRRLRRVERVFEPRVESQRVNLGKLALWERAVGRFLDWYEDVLSPHEDLSQVS